MLLMVELMEELADKEFLEINHPPYGQFLKIEIYSDEKKVPYNIISSNGDNVMLEICQHLDGKKIKIVLKNKIWFGTFADLILFLVGTVINLLSQTPERGMYCYPYKNFCVFFFEKDIKLSFDESTSLLKAFNKEGVSISTSYKECDEYVHRKWLITYIISVDVLISIIMIILWLAFNDLRIINIYLILLVFFDLGIYIYSNIKKGKVK